MSMRLHRRVEHRRGKPSEIGLTVCSSGLIRISKSAALHLGHPFIDDKGRKVSRRASLYISDSHFQVVVDDRGDYNLASVNAAVSATDFVRAYDLIGLKKAGKRASSKFYPGSIITFRGKKGIRCKR